MAEYTLGFASNAEQENFQNLRQEASKSQTQIFDATNSNRRMLFFAFDGTGDNKNDPSLGPPSNIARLFDAAQLGLEGQGTPIGKAFYYPGPGNQDNPITKLLDGATGMSVPDMVATAYKHVDRMQGAFDAPARPVERQAFTII